MAEQRLIDANLFEAYGTVIPEEYRGPGEAAFLAGATEVLERIDDAPTIDPETIPIVRQLRAELARVTAERDATAKDVKRIVMRLDNGEDLVQVCADFCANNNGVCVRHAEIGRFDECKGFAYRGPQKEE